MVKLRSPRARGSWSQIQCSAWMFLRTYSMMFKRLCALRSESMTSDTQHRPRIRGEEIYRVRAVPVRFRVRYIARVSDRGGSLWHSVDLVVKKRFEPADLSGSEVVRGLQQPHEFRPEKRRNSPPPETRGILCPSCLSIGSAHPSSQNAFPSYGSLLLREGFPVTDLVTAMGISGDRWGSNCFRIP